MGVGERMKLFFHSLALCSLLFVRVQIKQNILTLKLNITRTVRQNTYEFERRTRKERQTKEGERQREKEE